MLTPKKLTGRVPADRIRHLTIPRISTDILSRIGKLEDLTGNLSDAMDQLGLVGALPASEFKPTLAGRRMVGQAVTVRNVERVGSPLLNAQSGVGKMGEHEAYNLAEPGDVVVIEGLQGVSNMGGQSATLAARSGCAGAVIDGSYRDPEASRDCNFPIWARGVTPVTGKWRLETMEINGTVRIGGVSVAAGDVVAADEAGVVFVPYEHVELVLKEAERIDGGDRKQKVDIANGIDLTTLAQTKYK